MSQEKVSRKELLKTEDAFLHAAHETAGWAKTHRAKLVGGVLAVVVALAALIGGSSYVESRARTGSAELYKGLAILEAQVVPAGAEKPADPNATPPTYATEDERLKAARAQFEKAIAAGSPTGAVTLSRFMVASLSQQLGEVDAAAKTFGELASSLAPTDPLAFLAVERLAYLQETKGDVQGAIKTLSRIADGDKKRFYSDAAKFQQARLHHVAGEKVAARSLLEKMEVDHPESSILEQVRTKLAELGPKAAPVAEAPGLQNAPKAAGN